MSGTTRSLREIVSILQEKDLKATFLGIGPMSEVVIRATLELARDMEFPVMLIASRNQIDSDELGGGYVMGWNQKSFSEAVNRIAGEVGFDGLLYLCRDHGGPWQRDNERYGKLPAKEAMQAAKASYLADLEAGFNLIHVDPTKDPHRSGAVPMEIVLARTVELMEYVEEQAEKLGLSGVSYEVGTEETAGGLISAAAFEQFIAELLQKLDERHLPHPAFIVGQTGTLVKMDRNVGHFDPENTQRLCQIARKYGLGFKEHNADYLPLDVLEIHPELGITGANVAPEFGLMETRSLLKLAAQEKKGIGGVCIEPSDLGAVIQNAALQSGRWKKWLVKEDAHLTERDIAKIPEKLAEVTDVCGHYVFNQQDVRKAREKLYDSLVALRITNSPETKVVEDVKESIKRYVDVLNLEGINSRL
ncbi:class II D-tagatose-bisphosphate aldolase non-catalytic subunit [Candidatus Poribacteria bacterium]